MLLLQSLEQLPFNACEEGEGNSHDEDGGGDEWGRVETPLAVAVLPLPLVHLPSAVLTAAAHTEAHADDGREDHKQDADGGANEETGLVVGPLQCGQEALGSGQSPSKWNLSTGDTWWVYLQ